MDQSHNLRELITELIERFDSLERDTNTRHNDNQIRFSAIENSVKHLDDTFDEMHKKLFGNHRPGVIQLMENRISELEKWFWRVTGAIAAITAAVNIVMYIGNYMR